MESPAESPKRVLLEDVAREVGVSKATACRALLGRTRVADETVQKVRAAAARLGYRPDPALSALTRHRWALKGTEASGYHFALVRTRGSDPPRLSLTTNPNPTLEAIRRRAGELGVILSEWNLEDYTSPGQLARILSTRSVDGVIVIVEGPGVRWTFPWEEFSVLTIGYDQFIQSAHAVVPDWFGAVKIAVAQIRKAGYRRVGFASFFRRNPAIDDLIGAAIAQEGGRLREDFGDQPEVFRYPLGDDPFDFHKEREPERFWKWITSEAPDVIIDTNRLCYWWLKDKGIVPPFRIGYLTLIGQAAGAESTLDSVCLRKVEQGKRGVEILLNLVRLNYKGLPDVPIRHVVPCGWLSGTTLGSPTTPKPSVNRLSRGGKQGSARVP